MQYPKMLYIGTTKSHKHEIAQNVDHEAELRDLGFVDFGELEDEVNQVSGGVLGSASSKDFKNAFVPIEQFDAVSEELVLKELQFNVAQTERDQFKEDLDKALEEIQQLQQVIDSFKTEQKNVEPVTAETDYNSLTTPQLQKFLDEKGITYLKRDNKDTLISLLENAGK
ncbi:hypothetical protein [Acinetobacter wuhouensis]|uniref:HeH/LEM domain protein n=1 Tax=Acinetobacter wuhouensis TaxID=1879050 RepID=A0A4Q7AHW5_9GAMM|nr:hypothetical protein [Acinetobacter wuhouensis]RZG47034.1 hypothetical protein EXU28_07550 [Acinetobacter wuhouensis]